MILLAAVDGTNLCYPLLNLLVGADVHKKNEDHRTALHVAARAGHGEVARLLLNAGNQSLRLS